MMIQACLKCRSPQCPMSQPHVPVGATCDWNARLNRPWKRVYLPGAAITGASAAITS
jgi:hypothetical protein